VPMIPRVEKGVERGLKKKNAGIEEVKKKGKEVFLRKKGIGEEKKKKKRGKPWFRTRVSDTGLRGGRLGGGKK